MQGRSHAPSSRRWKRSSNRVLSKKDRAFARDFAFQPILRQIRAHVAADVAPPLLLCETPSLVDLLTQLVRLKATSQFGAVTGNDSLSHAIAVIIHRSVVPVDMLQIAPSHARPDSGGVDASKNRTERQREF